MFFTIRQRRLYVAACLEDVLRQKKHTDESAEEYILQRIQQFADNPLDTDQSDPTNDFLHVSYALLVENGDFEDVVDQGRYHLLRAALFGLSNLSNHYIDALREMRQLFAPHELQEHRNRQEREYIRDIAGNPFKPVSIDRAWITGNVHSLASSFYEGNQFDGMPILADALEDAGCTDQDILTHCREISVHVRGCWVIDQILGNERMQHADEAGVQ